MRDPFDEARQATHRDPTDAVEQQFDWEELYRVMDGELPESEARKVLEEIMTRLLQLLIPHKPGRLFPRSLGLRLLALAWVLNPGFFADSPSLRLLARRANVTPAKLSRHTGRISRQLRWRNRAQRHAWNWLKGQRSPKK